MPTTARPKATASAASSLGSRSANELAPAQAPDSLPNHAHPTVRQAGLLRRLSAYSPPPATAEPPATIAPAISSGIPPARGAVVVAPAGLTAGGGAAGTTGFGAGVAWAAASGAGPTATDTASMAIAASGRGIVDGRRRIGSPRSLDVCDPDDGMQARRCLSC